MARFSSSFWGGTEGPATSAAGAGRPSIGEAGTCAGLAGVCDATGSGPAVELAGGSEWRGGGELAGVVELAGGSAWEGVVELAAGSGGVVESTTGWGSIAGGAGSAPVELASGSSSLAFSFSRSRSLPSNRQRLPTGSSSDVCLAKAATIRPNVFVQQ